METKTRAASIWQLIFAFCSGSMLFLNGWIWVDVYRRNFYESVVPKDLTTLAFVEGLLCKSQSEYRVIQWLKEKTSSLAMHLHQKIYDDKQLSMVEQLSIYIYIYTQVPSTLARVYIQPHSPHSSICTRGCIASSFPPCSWTPPANPSLNRRCTPSIEYILNMVRVL